MAIKHFEVQEMFAKMMAEKGLDTELMPVIEQKLRDKVEHELSEKAPYPTIDEYLDKALEALTLEFKLRGDTEAVSDRDLSQFLKLGPTAVSNYRTKRAWPSDQTMLMIASLSGENPFLALMALNEWRAKSQDARAMYRSLAHKLARELRRVAAAILFGIGFAAISLPAPTHARTSPVHPATGAQPLYIMENIYNIV